jgi:hypothetical protein
MTKQTHALMTHGIVLLSTACIGVSQSRSRDPAEGTAASDQVVSAPPGSKLRSCAPAKAKPADDGLVDDFEDGDTKALPIAMRGGDWWKSKDSFGSAYNPDELVMAEPGADGTGKALHVSGHTASAEGAYGANFGVNLSTSGPYDAAPYDGVSFKAKKDKSASGKVRFKVGDINTHQDGGICKSCWNHFGKDITLTDDWVEYKILFAELKQAPGWGEQKPSLTVDKLWNLDWSIDKGLTFGVWLDDVQFIVCE